MSASERLIAIDWWTLDYWFMRMESRVLMAVGKD